MYNCTVIHTDEDFIIIDKPAGIASAPICKADTGTALHQAAEFFPDILKVSGRKPIEYGLVHRIDTATRGLLLIALNQRAYDTFIRTQAEGLFLKEYTASCSIQPDCTELLSGFPPLPVSAAAKIQEFKAGKSSVAFSVQSSFRSFGIGRTGVRPVTGNSGKFAQKKGDKTLYSTEITLECIQKNTISVRCSILKGYRHQVRCHLAWCNLPVNGDLVYNPAISKMDSQFPMQFAAAALEFPHPVSRKTVRIELPEM